MACFDYDLLGFGGLLVAQKDATLGLKQYNMLGFREVVSWVFLQMVHLMIDFWVVLINMGIMLVGLLHPVV